MKTLSIYSLIIASLLVYLAAAFIEVELNPVKWPRNTRQLCGFIAGGAVYCTIFYYLIQLKLSKPNFITVGTLRLKTKQQIEQYFTSLAKFKTEDPIFYNEQIADLTSDELEIFNGWLLKNTYTGTPAPEE